MSNVYGRGSLNVYHRSLLLGLKLHVPVPTNRELPLRTFTPARRKCQAFQAPPFARRAKSFGAQAFQSTSYLLETHVASYAYRLKKKRQISNANNRTLLDSLHGADLTMHQRCERTPGAINELSILRFSGPQQPNRTTPKSTRLQMLGLQVSFRESRGNYDQVQPACLQQSFTTFLLPMDIIQPCCTKTPWAPVRTRLWMMSSRFKA